MNEQDAATVEEYAYRTGKPDCDWPDHQLAWCGDCYVCVECGQKHISVRQTAELRRKVEILEKAVWHYRAKHNWARATPDESDVKDWWIGGGSDRFDIAATALAEIEDAR